MTELRQDLTFALRLLRRAPGFTALAIMTLALGIGGSTAIFTIVDSVLLRPLRFADPQRLTMISADFGLPCIPGVSHDVASREPSVPGHGRMARRAREPDGTGRATRGAGGPGTPNFFTVLGTPAFLGRTFAIGAELAATWSRRWS